MVVVRPPRVSTVTVPPFWAPSMLTGPFAFASLPVPVSPKFVPPEDPPFAVGLEEEPEPPQALSANIPTAETAINGDLNRIAHPFRGSCISPGEWVTGEFGGPGRLGWSHPGG